MGNDKNNQHYPGRRSLDKEGVNILTADEINKIRDMINTLDRILPTLIDVANNIDNAKKATWAFVALVGFGASIITFWDWIKTHLTFH